MSRGHNWWARWFLGLAEYIASASKDPSTQVGCVVVGPDREIRSTGFNGFPRGIEDDDRLLDRPKKLMLMVHAEENAINQAARIGVSLMGCTIYVSGLSPCCRCARSLIQAGVSEVVFFDNPVPERWQEEMAEARLMLLEAGVKVEAIPEIEPPAPEPTSTTYAPCSKCGSTAGEFCDRSDCPMIPF